ncbi:hypothetical protein RchiOBHm_Chr2g0134081 [Rosa chinensis]|uniref:Uncharacterized protein n=1 Tax=Rosa chinensis TaxID=74649 RepID=A0A2P6RVR7_ROSCH|nr:hypothetical protein RchiOBHm_Chr2g0134081 [Rosa chinensis]
MQHFSIMPFCLFTLIPFKIVQILLCTTNVLKSSYLHSKNVKLLVCGYVYHG